jgi:hypothetical protein
VRTFLLYTFLLIGALAVTVSVPRQIQPEVRLSPVWEFSFSDQDGTGPEDPSGETVDSALVFETDMEYVRLDLRDGAVLQKGLKGSVFTASGNGFVNQPEGAQRWVVQSWGESSGRYIDAVGDPYLVDSLLVQVVDRALHVTDIDTDASVATDIPGDLSAFDICSVCPDPVVVMARLSGGIRYLSDGGRTTRDIHESPFDAPPDAVVYGVSVLPSGDVVVIYGLDPQTVSVIPADMFVDGEGTGTPVSFELEPEEAVRHGVNMSVFDGGRYVIVPLTGVLGVIDLENRQLRRIDSSFTRDDVEAIASERYTLFSGNLRDNAHQLLVHDETGEAVSWTWEGTDGVGLEENPYRILLQVNDTVIALGLEL